MLKVFKFCCLPKILPLSVRVNQIGLILKQRINNQNHFPSIQQKMEPWLSMLTNHSGSPYLKDQARMYGKHSCNQFLVHEDLRPQEHMKAVDDTDCTTPQRRLLPSLWLLHSSTPTDTCSSDYRNLTFSATPSPIASTSSNSDSPSLNFSSGNTSLYIKEEKESPLAWCSPPHPYSIKGLIGDVLDKEGDPFKPAEVFSSTFLDGEFNKYVMYQSLLQSVQSAFSVAQRQISTDSTANMVYWCHVCNTLCVNPDDARKHKDIHVNNSDTCALRTTTFKKYGHVTMHERLGDERIQCGLCDKIVSQCFFSKHQRLHDGHFCGQCGKEFSTNSRLQDHMNTHTGNTPFTCTVCDRQFAKRSSWTQHQRYHRDHKSFMCQFCKKRFNSKYACAVHERLHTGDNPFRCNYPGCNRSYPQKIQLKLHMNSHR